MQGETKHGFRGTNKSAEKLVFLDRSSGASIHELAHEFWKHM